MRWYPMKGQVSTKPESDQAGDGCNTLRGLKPWEQAETDGTPLRSLTARLSMGMMNTGEPLVDPPIAFDSTPNGGDMGRETTQPRFGLAEGMALRSRGAVGLGRRGQAGVVGPAGSRLRADRGHLTPYVDDHIGNMRRLMGCPTGPGGYEAWMPISWRSRRSSQSRGKPGTRRRAAGSKPSKRNRR